MIKLKNQTFYYIYTDGKDIFMSEDEPIYKDRCWGHATKPFKLSGPPLFIRQEPLNKITPFVGIDHEKLDVAFNVDLDDRDDVRDTIIKLDYITKKLRKRWDKLWIDFLDKYEKGED